MKKGVDGRTLRSLRYTLAAQSKRMEKMIRELPAERLPEELARSYAYLHAAFLQIDELFRKNLIKK